MKKLAKFLKLFLSQSRKKEQGYITLEAAIITAAVVVVVGLAAFGYATHVGTAATNSGTAIDTNYNSTVTKVQAIQVQ